MKYKKTMILTILVSMIATGCANQIKQTDIKDQAISSVSNEIDTEKVELQDNNISINPIKEKIDKILSTVEVINERNILKKCEKEYKWLLANEKETSQFLESEINKDYEAKRYSFYLLLYGRINQTKNLYSQFEGDLQVVNLQNYTLDEVKSSKSLFREDDFKYRQYDWQVGDENYILLEGSFHLDDFILLFDEDGNFLDGRVWTDKVGKELKLDFRKKQNFISVSPVLVGHGTGENIWAGIWFEVYKGLLIERLKYVEEGYQSPPYTVDYTRDYLKTGEQYDELSGNFEAAYKIGTETYGIEGIIGINKKVEFVWNEEKEIFEPNVEDIYSYIDELYSQGIEDEILSDNNSQIEKIINEDSIKFKEDNIGNIAAFLIKCTKSEKRDKLLIELLTWYEEQSDIWGKDKMIEMINDVLSE